MDWLGKCAGEFGAQAIAANDLNTCKPVAERLGVDHKGVAPSETRREFSQPRLRCPHPPFAPRLGGVLQLSIGQPTDIAGGD